MGRVVYTDQSGREHSVAVGPENRVVSIGRATDCDIRSSKKSVSRHHAEVRFDEGTCQIVDLDSSNGTYVIVNGERQPVLSPKTLSHNDEVWCGDFILYFYDEQSERNVEGGDRLTAGGSLAGPYGPGNDLPGPSGDLGRAFDIAEGEAESSALDEDEFEEVEPAEVIGEFDSGTYEQIERLREEKQSVEDLASRQAQQIEDLQEELEEARSGASGEEVEELRERLEEFEEDNELLREEKRELTDELENLEEEIEKVVDEKDEVKDELADRERALESAQRDVEHLERQLERAEADAERADEASEQVQELKDEVERRQELIEDLEVDNRKLRDKYEERDEEAEQLESQLERAEEEADALRQQIEELKEEREDLQSQISSMEREVEDARASTDDYEQEIQGLKQRLSLKRSEQKKARRRQKRLEEENENLREQLEALQNGVEGQSALIPETAVATNMLSEVRNRAEKLHRMVDAIKRTDFEELPTVDRIRLESAIRETTPQENLEELLDLVGGGPEESQESEVE